MAQLHNDEPTLNDLIGCTELVASVGDAVVGSKPPQVLGVHGDWGSGKTSFLHQLQWYLTKSCPQQPDGVRPSVGLQRIAGRWRELVVVVWFEAWRYQNETSPVVALLHEIRSQLPRALKALKQTKKLGEVALRSSLLAFDGLTDNIGIQTSKIEQVGRDWEAAHLAVQMPTHQLRAQLEHAIQSLVGTGILPKRKRPQPRRLVVLVDDLDRCEPEAAYRLIEGIKIYLNLPNCVFVLGMNQQIIEGAIAEHLPKPVGVPEDQVAGLSRRRAREYLEKLCTNIWHLPLIREPAKLLEPLLGRHPHASDLARVAEQFAVLPPLPRRIKAYANLLLRFEAHLKACRQAQHAPQTDADRWLKLGILATHLYHFHPEIYRVMWSDAAFFGLELRPWCLGQRPSKESDVFHGLRLPLSSDAASQAAQDRDEAQPTNVPTLAPIFGDPAADDIFRAQQLVIDLGVLTETEWQTCLLQ